ncbi:MAG: tetratricopeptide repeat protein [Chloroflexi bacterium]|nr:tetratricopeptide repeat protein [Chloroflexota bacterium]
MIQPVRARSPQSVAFLALLLLISATSSEASGAPFFQTGALYLSRKEYSRAVLSFQAALERGDQHSAHLRLAEAYLARKDFGLAREQLGWAMARNATDLQALIMMGDLEAQVGNGPAAVTRWRLPCQAAPGLPQACGRIARLYFDQGQLDLAEKEFQDLFARHQETYEAQEAHYYLGLLLARRSPPSAAAHLREAARRADARLKSLANKALEEFPNAWDAEEPAYRAALLGKTYLKHVFEAGFQAPGALHLARDRFEKASELNPGYTNAEAYLGYTLWRQGQLDEAAGRLMKALSSDPGQPLAHYFLGLVFRSQGKADLAVGEFQEAIRQDPENPAFHADLGKAFSMLRDYNAAMASMEVASALAPDDTEILKQSAQFYLDHLLRPDRALALANRVVALAPQDAQGLDLLGWASYLNRDSPGARAWLEKATSLQPELASAHYHLAVVLEHAGPKQEAWPHYLQAKDLDRGGYYGNRAADALERLAQEDPEQRPAIGRYLRF